MMLANTKDNAMKKWQRNKTLNERFWVFVKKMDNGCWLFGERKRHSSYGRLSSPYHGERWAHRVSWIIHRGEIPQGLQVQHTCDTPRCVNPDHLVLGTNRDNMADMVKKGRSNRNFTTVMTRDLAESIRILKSTNKLSNDEIALLFNISGKTVKTITSGEHWTEKPDPEHSVVSDEIRYEIRRSYATGEFSQKEIAEAFHLKRAVIAHICQDIAKKRRKERLSEDIIDEISLQYLTGMFTLNDLASLHHLSVSMIHRIVNGTY